LVADGLSETTVVAFLADRDGDPFENEEVRFTLRNGTGFLSAPPLGADVGSEAEGTPVVGGGSTAGQAVQEGAIAVNGISIGNGLYVARFRSGTVPGRASVAAVWLSAPSTPLPEVTTDVELVTANQMTVRVDDKVLLADGKDEATVIAYVLDNLNRPVENAPVTFRIARGPGILIESSNMSSNGRYVAIYRAGAAPGEVTIEVALSSISRPLRERVTIDTVEAVDLDARAFPEEVARRPAGTSAGLINTSTILVSVRDGDGKLVRGLSSADLVAQVVGGPGSVSDIQEVGLASSEGSGVYQLTFTAGETTGDSTIRIQNLSSPSNPFVEAMVTTASQVLPGIAENLEIITYSDEPFYADGQEEALIVLLAGDSQGNAISGLDPTFMITEGQGELSGEIEELDNLSTNVGSGVYATNFVTGDSSTQTVARLRAVVANADGSIQVTETDISSMPLGQPDVVVFPPKIPAGSSSTAVIDVYDFDAKSLVSNSPRYRVGIQNGPGDIIVDANNAGSDPDLIADDNIYSALYQADRAAIDQQILFNVIDVASSGYPSAVSDVELGQVTDITPIVFPTIVTRGDLVEVVAFARDEFGLPSIDHDLILTLVDGSGEVLVGGRMDDDGGSMMGFSDAYANDGMYIGAFRASGIASGKVTLRIIDTTPSTQPSSDITIQVR